MVTPAGKASRPGELRYLNRPRPARVATDARGAPRSVALGRQAARVARIRDRWRVDDLWWREPLCRMYWEVELHDGRLLTLYHDRERDEWFAQPYHTCQPGEPGSRPAP